MTERKFIEGTDNAFLVGIVETTIAGVVETTIAPHHIELYECIDYIKAPFGWQCSDCNSNDEDFDTKESAKAAALDFHKLGPDDVWQ